MKKNYYLKKFSFFISFIIILLLCTPLQSADKFHSFTIKIKNPLHLERNDQQVMASVSAIKQRYMDFDENNFRIKSKGKSIPFDLVGDMDKGVNILFQADFKPDEQKLISFSYSNKTTVGHDKRTHAYLGIKRNYIIKDGVYTGGNFESTNHVIVPKNHFSHDALYQMEGLHGNLIRWLTAFILMKETGSISSANLLLK